MAKFKIWYDDQPNDVVDKISTQLEKFGLTIKQLDGDDGYEEYEIVNNNVDVHKDANGKLVITKDGKNTGFQG